MTTQHTPGPWHRNIKPATHYNTIFAGRNTHVARLAVEGKSEEEVEANCALIVAAPELLATLRSIEAKADYGKDNPRRQTDILFDILELAQVAIEKATEETYDNRHERQAALDAIDKATGGNT